MHARRSHLRSAFTLLELLVAIGIIAVLIGVLLPVLSTVQARGRDLKCQANLRSIVQAMHGYATENKGALPWGLVYNRTLPTMGGQSSQNVNGEYLSWATLLGRHWNRHSPLIADESGANFSALFPAVLQCPEAEQVHSHVVSYVTNYLLTVCPMCENAGHDYPGSLRRPTRMSELLRETAVVWDTAILQDWLYRPDPRLGHDIDSARFVAGKHTPQFRFYTIKDIFAHFPPGTYGQNKSVLLNVPPRTFYNRDPRSIAAEGGVPYPYQGNLRFRHRKDTTCNVGFSDGSVRQFTAKMNPDKTVKSHDAIRRYFMIKWPTGVRPDPRYPS